MESTAHTPTSPVLELLTRTGCHLCQDARTVVADVAGRVGMAWSEVLIDDNESLTARFGEEIPVVLVDGITRDFWHIDPVRLENVLRKALADTVTP